jgi:hypothetical protein
MIARRFCLGLLTLVWILSNSGCGAHGVPPADAAIYDQLKRDLCYNDPAHNFAIWVRSVDAEKLQTVTVKTRNAQGKDAVIAQADNAELAVDPATRQLRILMTRGELSRDGGKTFTSFEAETLSLSMQ